jgi:hypothetical protein
MKQTKLPKSKKKSFSSFDLASAYKQLGIKTLTHWNLPDIAIAPSEFFIKRLERLHRNFDLRCYEESKKLLIDAFWALHNVSVILWGVGVKPLRGAKPHTPIILLLCNAV